MARKRGTGGRITARGTRPANYRPDKRSLHDQAQQLKDEVDAARDRVADEEFPGAAADGKISVVLKGDGRAVSVDVDPSLVVPERVEELKTLLVEALMDAWTVGAHARKDAVDAVIANTKADLGFIGLDGIV